MGALYSSQHIFQLFPQNYFQAFLKPSLNYLQDTSHDKTWYHLSEYHVFALLQHFHNILETNTDVFPSFLQKFPLEYFSIFHYQTILLPFFYSKILLHLEKLTFLKFCHFRFPSCICYLSFIYPSYKNYLYYFL